MFEVREGKFGKKVVARHSLPAGSFLIRFTGQEMSFEETRKMTNESFALQIGGNKYVFLNPPCRYFNHSCEPNCGVTPELDLITIKHVQENEELTYDYSTTMMERSWTMRCRCGKKTCRGSVGDFDQLPGELQRYYTEKNVVQKYILEKLAADGNR